MSSKTKAPDMKKKTTPELLPRLRFAEFRGAKGWENKLIGPYLEDSSGRVPPDTELPVYSSTREGLKRQDAYFAGQVLQNKNEYGVVPPGCFVYRHMSDDGLFRFNINETGGEIAVSKEYPVFSTKGLNPRFLLAKLNDGLDFKEFALSQKAGGTRTRLYFDRLCEWRTSLPSPAEQQKIAECLCSVDELIAGQARKVDAIKTHKKGLMQQLFPREGETQPRLRFPEFQNAGEWQDEHLGDYFDPIRNGFVGTATPYYTTSDGVRYLQGRNIKQGRIEAENLVFITSEFHNRQRKSHLKTGDILMVQSGHVGECAVVGPDFAGTNCHALVILTPKRKLSSEFFAHYFYSPIGKLAIFTITTGNTIKHILASELKTLPVLVPGLAEQQRIASCLSSLDAWISAEAQKLEAFKTHKKGLMQQLFPSPGEIDA
ncbi:MULTISPECIES: restriction endonuclease subunit S [unclassified Caballeronia]|uniref:restriction endonuclease subunit S n=1 Tax=unclassified Caballeronia TaxID=2646786 RepID=UPI00158A1C71|nr:MULTISPECIES: restriction endonuclease subunit S [unclassified Caballeronia]QSN61333.1 restriction endonuclease subunit S [Caballeronia sp. M1242]